MIVSRNNIKITATIKDIYVNSGISAIERSYGVYNYLGAILTYRMEYKEIKTIGQGGFGKVKQVRDKNGNDFALKIFDLHPSMSGIEEMAKKRFIKEAIYQYQLKHPNIVEIFSVFESEEPPYYIMRLADKSMLDDFVDGTLNNSNFLSCLYDIMAGLEEMHNYGMYHRDLKPGNVLRFGDRYAIGDFGLISLNKTGITTLTSTGMSKSSDLYTAPEITQDLKFASVQSDIYSLGCIIHDFIGKSQRIPCSEISESSIYGDLLLSATRRDPSRRFSSVKSFREALNSVTQQVNEVTTEIAEVIKEKLEKPINEFNVDDISDLSDFLSSDVIQDEKNTILSIITLQHIEKIISYPHLANYIAKIYFSYVRNGSFAWDFCDTLATRVVEFMKLQNVDIISEGAFALLYMGTSHNRWYVERIAAGYFKGNIEPNILRRFEMECRVDGIKFSRAIDHLIYSIKDNIRNFNEKIQEVYNTLQN